MPIASLLATCMFRVLRWRFSAATLGLAILLSVASPVSARTRGLMRCAIKISVYRTMPLSKFTFIARSSSAAKIPDNYSIVRA